MGCCDLPASSGVGGTGNRVLQPALDGRDRDCCGRPSPPSTSVGGANAAALTCLKRPGRDRRRYAAVECNMTLPKRAGPSSTDVSGTVGGVL